jgi:hypothetical protein
MNDKQFEILKTELTLTQSQMDKYDQMSTTTKTWAVTLWLASSGWAFQVVRKEVFLVSIILVLIFWFFDALNKTFRTHYKKRRDEVAGILRAVFEKGEPPAGTVAPNLPAYGLGDVFKNATALHVVMPYFVLALISAIFFCTI